MKIEPISSKKEQTKKLTFPAIFKRIGQDAYIIVLSKTERCLSGFNLRSGERSDRFSIDYWELCDEPVVIENTYE